MVALRLLKLLDQLIEVIGGVREELVKSVFLALRGVVALYQPHCLAEARVTASG